MLTANGSANAVNTVVEGSATVVLIAFFHDAMREILPWLCLCIPFLVLDLIYGIRAARYRKDKVRFSTAIRRTVDKFVSYIMWVTAAVMMSSLFEVSWLDKVVLAVVYGNEFISIVGNYLETKGIELSFLGVWKLIIRKLTGKAGVEVTDEEISEVVQQKPRDAKGRYVKRS